jgi:hypothetical protein
MSLLARGSDPPEPPMARGPCDFVTGALALLAPGSDPGPSGLSARGTCWPAAAQQPWTTFATWKPATPLPVTLCPVSLMNV